MRKALIVLGVAAALVVAGCGGGGDTDQLEAQIAQLQEEVAAQQQEIDQLRQDTSSLRALEQRVDELLDKLPNLDQLGNLLDSLGIG